MAWFSGYQPFKKKESSLAIARAMDGFISADESKTLLGQLLYENLGFTWRIISGSDLDKWQEIVIRGWFDKDQSCLVAGRGLGKSYLIAIFCLLYCIFHENTTIVIVAANFRQVKEIFQKMETFFKAPGANLLRQCFDLKQTKAADLYQWNCLNGSKIKGLPMSGENLRGQRASVLIIDEGLMLSEAVHKTVLSPFLNSRLNANKEKKVSEMEDELIQLGKMTEEQRTIFSPNKMIITSSASYTFEYLYQGIWSPMLSVIGDEKRNATLTDPKYFAMRISYKALPNAFYLDYSQFKQLEEQGVSDNPTAKRENEAIFTEASDTYFNVKKLHECTIPIGESPTVQIRGDRASQYILTIDPAYGDNKTNDFFAMGVYMIVPEQKRIIQVHSFGRAGADIKDYYEYLSYILACFNIVWIVVDRTGPEFINAFNESLIAIKQGLRLEYIDANFDSQNPEDYANEIYRARMQWNISGRKMVYGQLFKSDTVRNMNEHLQGSISAGRIWFGAPLTAHTSLFQEALETPLPLTPKDKNDSPILDRSLFIGEQDDWIFQTKRQLGMIEVTTSALGVLRYDIPNSLKKGTSDTRNRKDNYTCLLLAAYGAKHLFEIMAAPEQNKESFIPYAF